MYLSPVAINELACCITNATEALLLVLRFGILRVIFMDYHENFQILITVAIICTHPSPAAIIVGDKIGRICVTTRHVITRTNYL